MRMALWFQFDSVRDLLHLLERTFETFVLNLAADYVCERSSIL